MDPHQQSQSGPELPLPQSQSDMIPLAVTPNTMPAAPEQAPQPSAAMPLAPQSAQSAHLAAPATAILPVDPQASGMPAHPSAPAVADDVDLIEKEWVEKAKAIVSQTRHDPYNQNKEMNKFKADYMQKRYNKQIKIEP